MRYNKSIQKMRVELLIRKLDDEYKAYKIFQWKAFGRYINAPNFEKMEYFHSQVEKFKQRRKELMNRKDILLRYRDRNSF